MKWEAKIITYKKEKRIAVYSEKNTEFIAQIKLVVGSRWSRSLVVWHIPDTEENRIRFKIAPLSYSIPSAEVLEQIQKFKQWLRSKRYSGSTITTYRGALKSFLIFYRKKDVVEITNEDVIVYNNEFILKNNLSASYQNQIVNAIKLFFQTIRETKVEMDKIHRPKRAKLLTNVLSKEAIKLRLNAHSNIKHKQCFR